MSNTPDDVKNHVNERFSQYAANYVNSDTHAKGHDLDRLLEVVAPQTDWLALDVATGGGHTALKFAPHVHTMVASDFSKAMLAEAQAFIRAQGAHNVIYTEADAEKLPFADNTFDLVTCRVAAHHFPDTFAFVRESARVLKPGGVLAIQDHLLPEDKKDAEYIEAFETLRDPSHHRAFNEYEWRGLLLDADLNVEHVERLARAAKMLPWAERQGCTPEVIERLHVLMVQASDSVKAWHNMTCVGTDDAMFDHVYVLITGRKA
ncbi:MAG: methyltransferase domain-containing protein [Chloroflexota bacterium]|nr:methyltransferase domain-containing protein [Chloroflexota bacterium]